MTSPTRVLVTGARGFIGRNLVVQLSTRPHLRVTEAVRQTSPADLATSAAAADVVVHLAGVNRPQRDEEFQSGNVGFTRMLCGLLKDSGKPVRLIAASSIQAEHDNPYGRSKRDAENVVKSCATEGGIKPIVFRLPNVFGKWCRPNYNSVVATFCYNVAHGMPIQVADPQRPVTLAYIDDVVAALIAAIEGEITADGISGEPAERIPTTTLTLGDLASHIHSIAESQHSLVMPDMTARFSRQLYATYLSYSEPSRWEYALDRRVDERGDLAEFIKSHAFGQVFVSRTLPGVSRGNHYHHTKTEKFLVLSGEGLIQFRHVEGSEVIEFRVRGEDYRVLDIPPGYTHSITNIGQTEMITLFWASEIFDPSRPDTQYLPVVEVDA